MSIMTKRLIILAILIIVGIVLGRLAVRGFMNLLMGGTMSVSYTHLRAHET